MRVFDALLSPERGICVHGFSVPEGAESLRVEVSGPGRGFGLVLALDPRGNVIADFILGVGTRHNIAIISPLNATVNAARGPVVPGKHGILVAFPPSTEPLESVSVRVEASDLEDFWSAEEIQEESWFGPREARFGYGLLAASETRWYKGDLHAHTDLSDGSQGIVQAGATAVGQKLEFIAFTDHNRVAYGIPRLGLLALPSFELTLPKGHFNIHGLKRPVFAPDSLRLLGGSSSEAELLDGLLDLFAVESNRSLNHPFMAPWELGYETLDISRIDTVEVICDPTFPDAPAANDKAAAFMDYLWEAGFRIYGVGGSDSHLLPDERYPGAALPSIYGDPATYVYCDGLSGENVLSAVARGRCYVSRFALLDISINGGSVLPGDRIPDAVPSIDYGVTVRNCPVGWKAFFVADGERVHEAPCPGSDFRISLSARSADRSWVRFGLSDGEGHIAAYVNPVYWGERARRSARILDLVREMDRRSASRG